MKLKSHILLYLIVLLTMVVLSSEMVMAANRYSVATGTWASTGTWSATSGGASGASAPVNGDDAIIEGGYTVTVGAAAACTNLSIANGSALTIGGFTLAVSGTTTVTGNINFNNATGTKTFTGNVTLNSGTIWNETAAAVMTFAGNFTNNATTFTASTGLHTFNAVAGGTISGATATVIPSVTFSTSYTNSGTLTCATVLNVTGAAVVLTNNGTITATTALSSTGGVNNGATGVINIGGTSTITTLTATTAGNTVNYNRGGAQTAKVTTYYNLTLSGTNAKTFATTPTVNGVLSLEGTASVVVTTGVVTYGANATLQYNKPAAYTATAEEWITPFASTGGVIIANTGAITMGAAKVFNADVPLTINGGATLTPGANLLTLGGNFNRSGTLTSGAGGVTITGTATTQSISGFTTTGSVSMTKTAGTATISGAVSAANLTVNGPGGTLVLSGSNTFSGTRTLTAGTLILGNTAALGAAGTALTVNGGTLDLMTDASVNAYNITVGGAGTISSNRATSGAGIIHTLGTLSIGPFTLGVNAGTNVASGTAGLTFGTTTLTGAAGFNVSSSNANLTLGALGGAFAITKSGVGQMILSTTSTRVTAAGSTTLNAGILRLNIANALNTLATAPLNLNGGTLSLGVTAGATYGGTATTVGGAATVESDLLTSGAGVTQILGTLSIGNFTLSINGGSNVTSGIAGVTFGATTFTGAPTFIVTNPAGGGTTQLSVPAVNPGGFTATINGNGNVIQTGVWGATAGGITYSGTGTLTLNQANTFTGVLTVGNGTVIGTANAGALGAGTLTLSGGVLRLTNASGTNLSFNRNTTVSGNVQITSDVTVASTAGNTYTLGTLNINASTVTIAGGSNVTSGTAGVTFGGTTFTGAPTFTVSNPAGGGTTQLSVAAVNPGGFTAAINGNGNIIQTGVWGATAGGITYSGTGILTLNQANTYTGGTTLSAGTLNINNASALGTAAGTFTINGGTIDNTSGADITTVSYPLALNNDFTYIGSIPRNLNLGAGNVTLSASRQITVSAGTLTIGGIINDNTKDITKAGGGTLSFGSNAITLNNMTISAGTLTSTSGTMSLAGNFSNNGTFIANGGTVNLNGTAMQTIGGSTATSFSGLTINNSNGIVIGGNTTVAGTLTLTSGIITTNAYSLSVSSGTVSRTSGYVIGNLNLYFAAGAPSHTFDIGDGSAYTPVTVSFASVTTPGSLTATTTAGDHPQIFSSGLNNSKSANRYWTLTNSGIVFTTYNVVFTFVPADLDGSAVPASFSVGRYSAGAWSTPTIGTRTATTTQALGIAAFGDFQLGNIQVSGLSNYTITRQTGITYNSIVSTGNSVNSWRHSDPAQVLDDNRSNPISIGFDFWYDGVRYTTLSVGINGLVDFSSSAATGFTAGDYDSDNPGGTNPHTRMTEVGGGYKARNALAVMYGDLTTMNITEPLGNSFKYLTEGTAPNRVLTVEWINLSYYSQYLGESYNFQLKLYESTGVIEYCYGVNTAGTGIPLKYKTGLNAPSFTALNSSVVLIQQNANSTNFLPQPVPAWGGGYGGGYNDTLPAANSKLIITPNVPNAPTSLSFSNVTQSSMRLSWNDVADNELGYVIYRSDNGGSTYTFIQQLAAGSTYSDETGLVANTTYYWRVYAFTEGGLSSALSGSYATLPAIGFISAQTGNWNTGTTWVGGAVPSTNADVTIDNGHIVTLDVNATLNILMIGQGSSGTLRIGNDGTARTLAVTGDLTIQNGATLDVNTAFAQTGHAVTLRGNLINSGILNLGPNASSAARITFNKTSGTQTISGTGATTNFYTINVNVGATPSDILEVTSNNFSSLSAGFLTLTSGTFKLSTGVTLTPFSGSQAIPSTAGLWINHASAVVNTIGGDLSVAGILRTTVGTLNIGNAANNRLMYSGGTFTIEGGSINVAGRIERANITTIIIFNMSGGVLTVPTVGSTSTTISPIELTVIGSTFAWSDGSIIVEREGGSGAQDLGYVNILPSFTVTGGTLQIGNSSTPAAQRMNINSTPYLYNILVNNTNATGILVGNNTILGNITVTSGALETTLNGLVNFNGIVPQNITASSPIIFNNLTLNNGTGLSLSSPITVTCTLTLTNGALSIGASTLTFQTSNTPIARTSGTITTTTSSNLVFGTLGNTGGAAFAIPASTFTAPPSINNFTINRTNSLTLNDQMMSLNGILLCNGPLTTNGNLTLLSTAAQTALIDGSSSGQVSGNVIMQRYLPSGFGYKYVSSPFQAATVNEFSNDLDLMASFPTFYKYDENRTSSGWVSYTMTTNLLNPMQGYAANFGSDAAAKTADVAGAVNNGILSITLYNHDSTYTKGFNLVGNPYPSPINWNAASGWTKTNIDDALYYFQAGSTDQYTGTYSTYINGISSDGLATNIVPSMQGFFIHVSDGSFPVTGTLGMTNSVRTNDLTHPFLKSMKKDTLPLLRITAGFADDGTPSDPAVIYFDSSATQLFDKNLDALKLMNTDILVPNLYTFTSDSKRLSISAVPFPADSIKTIPLGIKTAKDGWITFRVSDIEQMPTERYIYLVDTIAGVNQDLKINPQYRFFLKAGECEDRFSLVLSLVALNNIPKEFSLLQNYPNPFNPRTTIRYLIPQTSFVSITVYDILGREVSKLVNEEKLSGSYEVQFDGSKLSSGVYFYRLHAGDYFKTKKLMLIK